MPIEFVLWDHRFPLHKAAFDYLDKACKRSRLSIMTPEHTIAQARRNQASIYLVTNGQEIIGCFTLTLRTSDKDKYLELPLLGGASIATWRDMLVDFLFSYAEYYKCTKFTMIGRKGFERMFPEMKLLCCVYGRNLT